MADPPLAMAMAPPHLVMAEVTICKHMCLYTYMHIYIHTFSYISIYVNPSSSRGNPVPPKGVTMLSKGLCKDKAVFAPMCRETDSWINMRKTKDALCMQRSMCKWGKLRENKLLSKK